MAILNFQRRHIPTLQKASGAPRGEFNRAMRGCDSEGPSPPPSIRERPRNKRHRAPQEGRPHNTFSRAGMVRLLCKKDSPGALLRRRDRSPRRTVYLINTKRKLLKLRPPILVRLAQISDPRFLARIRPMARGYSACKLRALPRVVCVCVGGV